MNKSTKTAKQLERHFKGVANHHRIEIIKLIANHNDLGVNDISKSLNCNIKTISEHTRKLFQAGLVNKKYKGRVVTHNLSPYGKIFYRFLITF